MSSLTPQQKEALKKKIMQEQEKMQSEAPASGKATLSKEAQAVAKKLETDDASGYRGKGRLKPLADDASAEDKAARAKLEDPKNWDVPTYHLAWNGKLVGKVNRTAPKSNTFVGQFSGKQGVRDVAGTSEIMLMQELGIIE